jgi:hypothetical protein
MDGILKKFSSKAAKSEFEKFRQYLARQGNELSKLPELLPYFAIVVVKDPISHPTFSKIFTKEWTDELRNQLVQFIDSMYSLESEPFLVHMYQEFMSNRNKPNRSRQSNDMIDESFRQNSAVHKKPIIDDDAGYDRKEYLDYVQELENNNRELVDILQSYHNRYKDLESVVKSKGVTKSINNDDSVMIQQKWATFSKEILKLAKDIFEQLDETEMNRSHLNGYKNKINEFDKFLSLNMQDLMMERQTPPARPNVESGIEEGIEVMRYHPLDYEKVKGFLSTNSEQTEEIVYTILLTLERRITKGDYAGRKQTIYSFIYSDAFDIKVEGEKEKKIFYTLLTSEKQSIREVSLKLFNIIASDPLGRTFLTESEDFIEQLILILKEEKDDSKIRRRSLGILQNLSLRKKPQTIMIKNKLVETCFDILNREKDSLCGYSLDYFTALLMNLCLRKEGREICESMELNVLDVLENLLLFESNQVRTFINGILFSILSSKIIKKRAKETHFLERLSKIKDQMQERFQKQIEFIIEQAQKETEEAPQQFFEEETDVGGYEQDDEFIDDDNSEDNPNHSGIGRCFFIFRERRARRGVHAE